MMPIDPIANDFERADAMRDAENQKDTRIALRHFRPVMWNRHPEANEPDPLEPSDAGDMLAASEHAETSGDEP